VQKTKIEWVKNPDGTQGYTWNPITGCLNGCPYCYARRLANGRLRQRYLANQEGIAELAYLSQAHRKVALNDPFYPRFWEERIPPHTYRKMDWRGVPMGIFVCDMGELFGDWIPHNWQAEVFDVILNNPWHRFYLLTKQPQNLIKWSPFPDNCWVGVTVTTWDKLMEARFALHDIEAKVKYISFEPLLAGMRHLDCLELDINWLIIGACTGTYAEMFSLASRMEGISGLKRVMPLNNRTYTFQPKIEWVEEIVRAADKAGVKVFIKDNLLHEWGITHSPNFKKLPSGIYKARQEMPESQPKESQS